MLKVKYTVKIKFLNTLKKQYFLKLKENYLYKIKFICTYVTEYFIPILL